MENHALVTAHSTLVMFSILLAAGAVSGKIADWLKIPDVVLYLLLGIGIGPTGLGLINLAVDSSLNQLMLTLGAAFLLFHGGTGVNFGTLKEVWFTLLLLATLSVLVMVAIVGYAAHLVFGISLLYALLLAAILAPTDPATLVPIFLTTGVKERLSQTVISESAFNDATGAIVTFTLLGAITTGEISAGATVQKFLVMAGGGILIGGFFGLAAGFLISGKSQDIFAEYAQVLVLPLVISAYMTAEHFGASGFMAVFIAGLIFGNLDEVGWTVKESHQDEVHSFIHIASLLLRMVIFILLGSHVDLTKVTEYLLPGLLVVGVFMFVARPLAVLCCTLPDKKAKWSKQEILFMFWTRETGVIPAALVGMLTGMNLQHADMIAAVVFLAILATLSLQATTTPWLARKLDLLEKPEQTDSR